MKKLKIVIIFALVCVAVSALLLAGCSDKNSTEACLHQTTQDLDKGNYDAVLASPCADIMQIGAAWFGKAGYDITNVLNQFIDSNSSSTTKTDLNIYMTSLTGDVTDQTLNSLDNAKTAYSGVAAGSDGYRDAQFYISLVDAVKGLSLIRTVIPGSINPDGTLNTSCDRNNNGVPDDADATACALRLSAGQACTNMTIDLDTGTGTTLTLLNSAGTGTLNGQYRGLLISQTTGTGPSSTCPSPNQYKRLLFNTGSSWATATLSAETCNESTPDSSRQWPCPLQSNGAPIDFVTTVNDSLDSAVTALDSAITGTTDVQQSIKDIQIQACCGGTTPCTTDCTADSIASYLQNNLK